MSHFVVYVFSKDFERDVEELLAPYDENLEYEPYVEYTREQAIASEREEILNYKNTIYAEYIADPEAYEKEYALTDNDGHIKYLRDEFPKRLSWTDDECYEEKKKWYDEESIDKDGNLLSTRNPKAKWDWYVVGGRWAAGLMTLHGEPTDEDYVSEIDWDKTVIPFAFVTPDGVWHERGTMGWWACVSNEKLLEDWTKEFKDVVEELKKDKTAKITLVDCHI